MKNIKANQTPVTSRRHFLAQTAGLAATVAAAGMPASIAEAAPAKVKMSPDNSSFPRDFFWGAATAAYQIEGAANEDGRKPSVWDTFSRIPGRTKNGDTGDVACDHYHRFKDDIKLMVELGIKHYRFSIAWPRIMPDGRGAVNEKGVDFYRRLADSLLESGITPHATLLHWDSPQALEDLYGSWRSREMAKDFAEYCSQTVRRLGDRIRNWMTINEPQVAAFLGHFEGMHAPGLKDFGTAVQSSHVLLHAHALAVSAFVPKRLSRDRRRMPNVT